MDRAHGALFQIQFYTANASIHYCAKYLLFFFCFLSVVDMNPSYVPTTGHGATSGMSRRRPLSINNRQLRYSSVGVMPHVKLDPSPAKHLLGEHNTAMTRQVTVKIAPPEMSKSPMYVLLKKM